MAYIRKHCHELTIVTGIDIIDQCRASPILGSNQLPQPVTSYAYPTVLCNVSAIEVFCASIAVHMVAKLQWHDLSALIVCAHRETS